MAEMPDPIPGGSGRKPRGTGVGASSVTARRESDCGDSERLMEAVVERGNMTAAYKRVIGNKGSAGVDGMGVDELRAYLDEHWERIKSELLEDRYKPQAVRAVEIGKPDGGVRQLGIPTVVDRLIGQAITSGTGTDIRPWIFGVELRVQARAECAAGGGAGAEVCSGGL